MEYTVQKLARLVGVSARTLRYYDQIGLLRPARVTDAGYRLYGPEEVDALQQILLYREMEVPLAQIGRLMGEEDFDRLEALRRHRESLLEKRARIDKLIETVQRSIAAEERGIPMEDKEKFEGFKKELIEQNEAAYGPEIRQKYGDETVDASNVRLMGLTPEAYREMEALGKEVLALLDRAFAAGDPGGEAAREAVDAHRRWLGYTWSEYSPEAHIGLGEMYAADERFAAHYDRGVSGKAVFFRDCIREWADSE